MTRLRTRLLATVGATSLLVGSPVSGALAHGNDDGADGAPGRHVLLLSIDGLHQSDLAWYVRTHPSSALARLVKSGTSYTHAETPAPSDSFPGLAAQVTGGNPKSTGIYYDVAYNRALLPAGTTVCAGAAPGAKVSFDESIDRDLTRLDAGQGLAGLPGSILQMTAHPEGLLQQPLLPVDPATCRPVSPHSYLQVNTVFEVAERAGLRTAWSDKHPAYDLVNGPSGTGVDDLFTPEINSNAPGGGDWTKNNAATQQYDVFKVKAVVNELHGRDHSGAVRVGVPAILGMNFQSVSTAQKLPTSDGASGGYLPGGKVPGPVLSKALDFVDASVGTMVQEIAARHLTDSTTVILSAKHGQSPTDPLALTRIDDGALLDGLNAAWRQLHPAGADLVTFSLNDDSMLLWLSDRSRAATAFAKSWLLTHPVTGHDIKGAPRVLSGSGLSRVFAGQGAADFYGVSLNEARHPDFVGVVQHGVVYTGGTKKIAEHGGMDVQDRNVPIVVAGGRDGRRGHTVATPVETTQIAPTILSALGLDPRSLKAVRLEGTRVLPGQRG